jgi:hypothetical protein
MTELEGKPITDMQALSQLDAKEVANTPGFQEWAGESWQKDGEVVMDGEAPAVFYHGGVSGVEAFSRDNPRNTGAHQHGIYFSPRLHDARFYADKLRAEQIEEGQTPNSSVYAVMLKMKNPYEITQGDSLSSGSINEVPKGHDGIVNPTSQEVVVFNPSQIFIAAEAPRLLHR